MSFPLKRSGLYIIAAAVPFLIGLASIRLHQFPVIATYLFFLWIAVVARFFGFGPSLVSAVVSTAMLSWEFVFPTRGLSWQVNLLRVSLFLIASVCVATISRQRSRKAIEAEERYRNLVDLSPDGTFIFNEQNRILFANQGLVRMLRLRNADDLIGKTVFDFIDPSFHEVVRQRIAAVTRDQATLWLEEKWVRLDGTRIDVECAAVPTRKEGKLVGQVFVRDLTQQKQSEAALDENRRRMMAVFDASLDAMIFLDDAGHYVDANPAACELWGYRREELITMKVGDLVAPENRSDVLENWQLIRSGKRLAGEYRIRRKDGSAGYVEYRAVVNVLPGLHFAVMHDITGRKLAEAALQRLSGRLLHLQDEERKRIALQLHETTAQNLIALRLNLAKVKRSRDVADESLKETLDESLVLTEQSISEIRTLSYLLHPPMIEEMGLVPSLRWFAAGFEERTGIRLDIEASEEMGRLPASVETALFRIVQEAFTNVQRHSGSSVAWVRLLRQSAAVELTIEDEGRGMPERLRGQPVEVIAAAGVGVAGLHQRVKDLAGTMEIHSDDHGTRIEVALPIGAD